ncbi:hypothetical protein QFZ80_005893 [Paenibacillus sp. V4I7]|nr:hypothetical protein [Paenibacillus sp. V4I7]
MTPLRIRSSDITITYQKTRNSKEDGGMHQERGTSLFVQKRSDLWNELGKKTT